MRFFINPERPSVIVDENGVPVAELYGGADLNREAQYRRTILVAPQALEVLLDGILLRVSCLNFPTYHVTAPSFDCTCARCNWVRRAKALVDGG